MATRMKRFFVLFLALLLLLFPASCSESEIKKDPSSSETTNVESSESAGAVTESESSEAAVSSDALSEESGPGQSEVEQSEAEQSEAGPDGYYRRMVVLGDSIAQGYGLADPENTRYSALLVRRFSSLPVPLAEANYAVSGATSGDVLLLLKNDASILKDADLVIISAGANNVFRYFGDVFFQHPDDYVERVLDMILSGDIQSKIDSSVRQFRYDIPRIIEVIRETAPEADILFQTVYNPYKGARAGMNTDGAGIAFDIGKAADGYVEKLNEKIRSGASLYGYTVAEVYTAFQNDPARLVNALLDENGMITSEVDPHPNPAGHEAIANVILETLRGLGKVLPQ